MQEYLLMMLAAVLVNNVVLVKFLGLCSFMGTSNRVETALGMGMATTFVMTFASLICWAIDTYLLAPFDLGYLRTLNFILVIAALVQFTEMVVRKFSPALHQSLGIFLPLITTNCAILGVALLNNQLGGSLLESLTYGLGYALGYALILIIFTGIRERLAHAEIPGAFAGAPAALVAAGLLSLAFMGFSGIATH